jgi:cytochrome c peroxidase
MTQSSLFRAVAICSFALLVVAVVTGCHRSGDSSRTQSEARIALGQKIFSDKQFSSDGSTSCSSCHDPKQAFTDSRVVSVGVHHAAGTRNAPSLSHIAETHAFFWDGREQRLATVVLQPFTNPVEMGLLDTGTLVRRVDHDPSYQTAFAKAFADDNTVTEENISASLAAYLSSLPQGNSRYDAFVASHGRAGLNPDERAGLSLFDGKAGCSQCHLLQGPHPTFTDELFHHTGVGYDRIAGNIAPLIAKLNSPAVRSQALGHILLTNQDVSELGRFAVTQQPVDLGAFRTPSLRNVVHTAPYMHDGSVPTLQAAVEREIYYRSLQRGHPIQLTVPEQKQLLAFLGTLSDQ